METTFIYALKEINGEIRYVGKSDDPKRRFRQHKSNARKEKSHKVSWIQHCINNNIEIELIILEEVLYNNWQEREIYWIEQFQNLTNHDKGGRGGKPIKYMLTYNECKNWIKNNIPHINSQSKWIENMNNLPDFISKYPIDTYKFRGWISWGDFLNTNRIADQYRNYLNYGEAKKWCKENNIKSRTDYHNRKPANLPYKPERTYKNEWISWFNFLSKE